MKKKSGSKKSKQSQVERVLDQVFGDVYTPSTQIKEEQPQKQKEKSWQAQYEQVHQQLQEGQIQRGQTTPPQYTVFVPSDHDILFKVVPSKKFFEKRTSEDALSEFGLDEKTQLINRVRYDVECEYAKRLDILTSKLPKNILKDLAAAYMEVRNIKGNKDDLIIDDGLVLITDSKGKQLNLRLDHMLAIICSFPPKATGDELRKSTDYYKKIAKTSKIDAETRKSF
jgi:hypothetical protein